MEIIIGSKMFVPDSPGLIVGPTLFIGLRALTSTLPPPFVVRFSGLDHP